MMFGGGFRVIWKQTGRKYWFLAVFLAKKPGLTPWDFGQHFKFAQDFPYR